MAEAYDRTAVAAHRKDRRRSFVFFPLEAVSQCQPHPFERARPCLTRAHCMLIEP